MIHEKLQAVTAANWSLKSCYEELSLSLTHLLLVCMSARIQSA